MSKQFIDEVNQDIKDEKLVTLWHRFKYLIVGGAVAIVAATGGYSWYTSAAAKKMESQNVALDKALGDVSALDTVIANSADGVQFIAVINKAKLLTDDKKYDDAIQTLNTYAAQTTVPIHRQYAQLSAIWIEIEAGKTTTVPTHLIQSLVFGDLAKLTKAEILLKSGDTQQAADILQSLVDSADAAQEYKSLAMAILQGI